MNKSKISFKTVIAIIGAYAAYGIGSGFATGRSGRRAMAILLMPVR